MFARLHRPLAWAALAFVSWRGAASLYDGGAEMGRWSRAQRERAWSEPAEERLRRALGDDFALWRALDARVPPDAHVIVLYRAGEIAAGDFLRRLQRLRAASCPRLLDGFPYDARRAQPIDVRQAESAYVLDLDSGFELERLPHLEVLERGAGFTLGHAGTRSP